MIHYYKFIKITFSILFKASYSLIILCIACTTFIICSRQIQNYTQKLAKDTSSMLMELMKLPVDQPAQKLQRDRLSDEYISTLNAFQVTISIF